jgi:NAD-dependent SIR2 family protein deacetylase
MRRKRNAPPIPAYVVRCTSCGYDMPAIELTRNTDGDPICSKCGKPIPTLVKGRTLAPEPVRPKSGRKGDLYWIRAHFVIVTTFDNHSVLARRPR